MLFKRLFGSEEVILKALDKMQPHATTPQERAENVNLVFNAYEPFKVTQRVLTFVITVPFVLVWVICAILLGIGAFIGNGEESRLIEVATTIATLNNDTLSLPVVLVLSFYFAGGAFEGIVAKFKQGRSLPTNPHSSPQHHSPHDPL